MKGDFQARFRENVGVKFPCVTRLPATVNNDTFNNEIYQTITSNNFNSNNNWNFVQRNVLQTFSDL